MQEQKYTPGAYEWQREGSKRAGIVIFKLLSEYYQFHTVVDVGCGEGATLAGALEVCPHLNVYGIDGEWVQKDRLMIPQVRFFTHDLNEPIPFNMVVDLGTCLEVAEHITPEAAKNLIKWLCEHSKIILFSGAQPKQGGMGHINEQWMCHWIGLFNEQGWSANGWIRETLWDDTTIPWWYRQNILMFEHKAYVRNIGFVLDCIHPGKIDGSK